jgi:glycosyltransferase involved in cell wall biosynthesis
MKTGTARYFSLFLEACGDTLRSHQPIIVTPLEKGPIVDSFMGIPVLLEMEYESADEDVLVAFVANNRFHKFIFPLLERRRRDVKVISVIHDPQCFMNVESLHWNAIEGFDVEGLQPHLRYELPNLKDWILSRWKKFSLPSILKYNLMAQSKIIESSDVLIVHSYYAALRLLLESSHGVEMPPILVMQHPKDRSIESTVHRASDDKFVVGCFGWISESKRPISIVAGFSRFLSTLSREDRAAVQLKFVGELADKSLDPLMLAKMYGCEENCVYLGHVPDEQFLRDMSSVNLLFNLRFPSCGETSGTLSLANEVGVRVAMSSYQAFREENADFLISLSPDNEVNDICAAIKTAYQGWIDGEKPSTDESARRYSLPEKFDVHQALEWVLRGKEAAT